MASDSGYSGSDWTSESNVTAADSRHQLDDDDSELSERLQILNTVQTVAFKLLVPPIVVFGCAGNVINIVVLTRKSMKSSTNRYLTSLAVYDILYLVFAFSMICKHYDGIGSSSVYVTYMARVGHQLTDTCSNTGVWLTVTFAVERYICVCFPMKALVWCTPRRAKYVIIAVVVAAAVLTTPEFFATTAVQTDGKWIQVDTEFGESPGFRIGYSYVNQALFTFLPLIVLILFNTLLVRVVINAARQRQSMTSAGAMTSGFSGDQHRITVMLICVVIVFIVCQVPQAVCLMVNNLMTSPSPWQQINFRLAATVSNMLVMINSSSNFVLYSSLSTNFRRTFRQLFCAAGKSQSSELTAVGAAIMLRNRNTLDYRQIPRHLPPPPPPHRDA